MVRATLTDFPAHRFRKPQRNRSAAADRRESRSARHPFRGLADRFGAGAQPPPVPWPPERDPGTGGTPFPRALVVLLGAAAAVVVLAGIQSVAWLVGPVFLALVVVITLDPVRKWLRDKGMPRWLTVTVLVVAVYAVLLAFFLVVVVSVAQLSVLVPRYAGRVDELTHDGLTVLGRFGVGEPQLRAMLSSVDAGKLVGLAGSLLAGVGGLVTNLAFLFALLLFLSAETAWAGQRLGRIAQDRPWISAALRGFASGTRRYLLVTTVFGGLVAALDTTALALLGVPGALLWGLLAFVTNYIPNVGFVIGVAPPAVIALLDGGWRDLLVVLVVYAVLNFVVQSLVQPRFVAGSVGLSTLVTVLALVFWTWLLGPLGAILAVPATLLAKALLVDVDPRARWADALLSAPRRDER
ncbi:AI-2E family transporter [Amycolatopsis balhimycina DSM 5908]|uniref:AI-2E family transporter n=1 Tax=Amycolatopsis balhimycina DSM 5908 TaxID=1081091 RepID=A0A428WL20_AMYBA|nr:AI-2E family transporter [Amycolatopsis balhimycina]RSM43758.1 AI-2E family transporter [Amycolatopsis balhimycina DSM 5908]